MYNIQEVKSKLKPVFDSYNVKSAILFGSIAKNEAHEKSDVDILVDSGLHGIAFFGLLEDVVNVIGRKVDLIDKSQVEIGSKIDSEIKDTGVMIYG